MKVERLMTKQPVACGPNDSLARAAQLMWEHDCGSLPVCADDGSGRVVGIITDRDICMSAHFKGRRLAEQRVAHAMTDESRLRTLFAGDSHADVQRVMEQARVRRVPVVDGGGVLVGMVTLADLARQAAREKRHRKKREVGDAVVVAALAAICEPDPRGPAAGP